MKIVSIVGARPQFIKVKPVAAACRKHRNVRHVLVHTGQHYDYAMSRIFFQDLDIPAPDHHLRVGSGTHGAQTADILRRAEKVLLQEKPDWVVVYGDTNSTLGAGLAAAKLDIRVAHVEAGLRSYRMDMPEEINRVLTDHASSVLFCPTANAVSNLKKESITRGVYLVGDVMYDAILQSRGPALRSGILARLGLQPKDYLLLTVHRKENTDTPGYLRAILAALGATGMQTLFPVHPRTRAVLRKMSIRMPANIRCIDPVGYLDMLALECGAGKIVTDSGGVQKEAFWLRVPCITLRRETEWRETLSYGWNRLVPATDMSGIRTAILDRTRPGRYHDYFGDGTSAASMVEILVRLGRA